MDSLRYWVTEMHVDGFRFDLASALARELHDVDRLSAFFDIIHQDPVIAQVKLIAEPWDVGEGGYQVGNFPVALVRVERTLPRHRARLLARRAASRWPTSATASPAAPTSTPHRAGGPTPASTSSPPTTASRCATSSATTRSTTRPTARTTATATTHNRSLELRRRGPDRRPGDQRAPRARSSATSWPRCCSRRACRCCSAATRSGAPSAATTTPTARTTRSAGSTGTAGPTSLLEFTRRLIAFRHEHPVFRRRRWFQDRPIRGRGVHDIEWFAPDGRRDERRRLGSAHDRAWLGVFLSPRA